MKNKLNTNHSIEDIYKKVENIETYIKEFKLKASDINFTTKTIQNDINNLRYTDLNNFIDEIITQIDEIKSSLNINFTDYENKLKNEFNDFDNTTRKTVKAEMNHFIETFSSDIDLSNQTLLSILKSVDSILDIINKEKNK